MSDRVKLNVGGTIFETTKITLRASSYFTSLFDRWTAAHHLDHVDPYFIDRSGVIFEHVLGFLRNPDYVYPEAHLDELKFYGIDLIPQNVSDYERKLNYCYNVIYKHLGLCKELGCENFRFLKYNYCEKHGKIVPLQCISMAKKDQIVWRNGHLFKVIAVHSNKRTFGLKSLSGEIIGSSNMEGFKEVGKKDGDYYYTGIMRYFHKIDQVRMTE